MPFAPLRPGGAIYVGDVRNLQLLPAYHAAVQLHQAGDDLPLAQLQAQIQQRLREEEELLIDPDFFYALPQRFPEIELGGRPSQTRQLSQRADPVPLPGRPAPCAAS